MPKTEQMGQQLIPSTGTDNLCGFASMANYVNLHFGKPPEGAAQPNQGTNNPLVRAYWQKYQQDMLDTNNPYSGRRAQIQAHAMKKVFASILLEDQDDSEDTPFQLTFTTALSEYLRTINPEFKDYEKKNDPKIENAPIDYERQDPIVRDILDILKTQENFRAAYNAYKDHVDIMIDLDDDFTNKQAAKQEKYIDGSLFYSFLKHNQNEHINTAKTYYCEQLVNPENAYPARAIDLVYFAKKLRCVKSIHFQGAQLQGQEINPAGQHTMTINNAGFHWEIVVPLQQNTIAQQTIVPAGKVVIDTKNTTLLHVFGDYCEKLPSIQDQDCEINLIAQQDQAFIKRTEDANNILDDKNKDDSQKAEELDRIFRMVTPRL